MARLASDHLTARATRWPTQDLHIGISGWTYAGWRGRFYPKKLAQRLELQFASGEFNSMEINGSFYSLQLPSSYQRWYVETPPGFVFSVKGSRFITHMKKLRDIEAPLANFLGSGVLCLREKLGPIRHAIEIRHPTFMVPEFFALLRRHNIAFVMADTAGKWPYSEDLTADFVYCRLHGSEKLYVSGYSDGELDRWADRIRLWRKGKQPKDARIASGSKATPGKRDVYIYFDNDAKVHAPFNAGTLASKLQIQGAAA